MDRCYHHDPRRLQWLFICDDVNGKDDGSKSEHLHQRGKIHREAVSFNVALIESYRSPEKKSGPVWSTAEAEPVIRSD